MRKYGSSPILRLVILVSGVMCAAASHAEPLPTELAFLAGCWRGEIGADGSRIIEQYSDTEGEMLLGQLKTVKDDTTVFFEFLQIAADDDGVWLQPFPNGNEAPVKFRLVELEPDKASFDNPAHDFPRRISYRLLADGSLLTRIAGVIDERAVVEEYRTLPVACE
jgi:hypothetical protein